MKITQTNSILMHNGDVVIGCNGRSIARTFYVNTEYGIFVYSYNEMMEVYGEVPEEDMTNKVGVSI